MPPSPPVLGSVLLPSCVIGPPPAALQLRLSVASKQQKAVLVLLVLVLAVGKGAGRVGVLLIRVSTGPTKILNFYILKNLSIYLAPFLWLLRCVCLLVFFLVLVLLSSSSPYT